MKEWERERERERDTGREIDIEWERDSIRIFEEVFLQDSTNCTLQYTI